MNMHKGVVEPFLWNGLSSTGCGSRKPPKLPVSVGLRCAAFERKALADW